MSSPTIKSTIIFIYLFFISNQVFSQTIFKKGYYLKKDGLRVECLILDKDWNNNPQFIETKASDKAEATTIYAKDIDEFEIYENSKYISRIVNIDISPDDVRKLNYEKGPVWELKEVFLKVLFEGEKASLFYYNDFNYSRLFFSTNIKPIEQLIFKRYIVIDTKISHNLAYKAQLIDLLGNDQSQKILNMSYNEKKIIDIVKSFNDSGVKEYTRKEKRDKIELKVIPGVSYSNLTLFSDKYRFPFQNQIDYRFGFEFGITVPFFNNSLSLITEPNIYISPSRKDTRNLDLKDIDFKFITFPVGIKGKTFLENKGNIFYKGLYDFGTNLDALVFERKVSDFFIFPGNNFSFGLGYEKGRSSLEFRYVTNSNILRAYKYYRSDHQRFMIIYGFRVFKK